MCHVSFGEIIDFFVWYAFCIEPSQVVIMLRLNMLLALAFAGLTAAPVSADFIDAPSADLAVIGAGLSDAQPATTIDPHRDYSVPELWRDSAYLELGYYAVDGQTSHKQLARPNDAELTAAPGQQASLFGAWSSGEQSGALARLSAGVASLLGIAAFATRRHWLSRPSV
jgi:hypothetical protein